MTTLKPISALGQAAQAFTLLDRACEDHSFFVAGLKAEPLVDSLRADPRFAALLKKVGLN